MSGFHNLDAANRELIVGLASRLGMTEWTAAPDTVITVGDGETFYALVAWDDQIAFVETQRGHAVARATFGSVVDAVRHLVSILAGRPRPARPATPLDNPEPDERPRASTLKARPVETPPADPSADAETRLTLAAAAEIGMTPRPRAPGDLLAVGWNHAGRFLSYWHGAFQYQVGEGDRRTILATTSTAAAARRLLVTEAAEIAREHRRQQPVHLRVRGPAVDFTLTKGPTELVVEGAGLRATFPLGPIGLQRALVFTYCADATLEAILASYRDPGGAPLLTSGLRP